MVVPELSVHIVQRGHDRARCFFRDDDYRAYLELLSTFASRAGCSVHAYCLMTNHVHLFVTPHSDNACAQLMKNVGQRYVQSINARRGRTGTLWEGRFYSCPVPGERYALACYRYVDCNPVRAGMISRPGQYEWSSYRANAARAPSGFIAPHPAYLALSDDAARRAAAYGSLCDVPLPVETIDDLRRSTRRGYAVGSPPRPRGRPWQMRKMGSVPI